MSVAIASTSEFAKAIALYRAGVYKFCAVDNSRGPDVEEFAMALVALHYANVMAYALTYSDDASHIPSMIDPNIYTDMDPDKVKIVSTITAHELRAWVRSVNNLVWNTISNAGTHCLPRKYEQIIEGAVRCIIGGLAGMWRAS